MTLHNINTNNAAHADREPVGLGGLSYPLFTCLVVLTGLHVWSYLIKGDEDVRGSLFVRGLCDGAARLVHALRQVTATQPHSRQHHNTHFDVAAVRYNSYPLLHFGEKTIQTLVQKRREDNIPEWTGMTLGVAMRKVERREEWRDLVARSSVAPQRSTRLRDR